MKKKIVVEKEIIEARTSEVIYCSTSSALPSRWACGRTDLDVKLKAKPGSWRDRETEKSLKRRS